MAKSVQIDGATGHPCDGNGDPHDGVNGANAAGGPGSNASNAEGDARIAGCHESGRGVAAEIISRNS